MSKRQPIKYFAKLRLILLFFVFLWGNNLQADHYYGGYFYYEVLSAKTYKVTLVTYTDDHNSNSDRDSVRFFWGDNSSDLLGRINNAGLGEKLYAGLKKNIYQGVHTYKEFDNYKLYFSDSYRLNDVLNMGLGKSGVSNLRFDGVVPVQDSSLYCQNNSPQPICDPYFYGVQNQSISLNFAYWDKDGDSIVYELTNSLGANGKMVEGYNIPTGAMIDPTSGQFTWSIPKKGKYSFAFLVKEYRDGELLGLSSTDFTLFISQVSFPKLTTGTGGITSGSSNNSYSFSNFASQEFTFEYNYPAMADSIVGKIKSPLSNLSQFALSNKSKGSSVSLKDTLKLDYLSTYLLQGHMPIIWEVRTYLSADTVFIQQFPLMISVKNELTWACQVHDISKVHEVSPELETYSIAPNLFDEHVWINIGSDYAQASIYVYDTRGRRIKTLENLGQSTVKIDMFGLSSAMYFLQVVKNNKVVYTGKMIKK